MNFFYTDVAKDDLRDILTNLKTLDQRIAEKFLHELDLKKSMLVMFPLSGTKISTPSLQLVYRFVKINGYLLVYTINKENNRIEVSRILAERTNWKFLIR